MQNLCKWENYVFSSINNLSRFLRLPALILVQSFYFSIKILKNTKTHALLAFVFHMFSLSVRTPRGDSGGVRAFKATVDSPLSHRECTEKLPKRYCECTKELPKRYQKVTETLQAVFSAVVTHWRKHYTFSHAHRKKLKAYITIGNSDKKMELNTKRALKCARSLNASSLYGPSIRYLSLCLLVISLVRVQVNAQVRTDYLLRGEVLSSANGTPVENATVVVEKQSSSTDKDGKFTIHADKPIGILTIKHIGFKERSVAYENISTFLKISLQPIERQMEEVEVISTGYQKIAKERATGSFDYVDNKRLNQTVSGNIIDRLELQVPGLLVDRNEGAPDKFLIRGRSSIFADVQPLIVLDGFPYDGEIANINPNDIESVTVLKDAAAAAIWGARAGNGVIVISTKRARSNKPSISFNTTLTRQARPDLSTISQISSADYIELEKFLFEKGHYANDEQYDDWNYGHPPFTPVIELLRKQRDEAVTPAFVHEEIEKMKTYDSRKEVLRELYRNSMRQQHALNIGKKSNSGNYFFSMGYDQTADNLVGQGNKRLNMRFNMDNDLSKWLSISNSLSYINSSSSTGNNAGYQLRGQAQNVLGGNKGLYPYARLRDDEGKPTFLYLDNNENYVRSMLEKGLDWSYSPLEELKRRSIENGVRDFLLNSALVVRPAPGLQITLRYQFEDQLSDLASYYMPDSYYARAYSNSFVQEVDGKYSYPVPQSGILDHMGIRKKAHQGRVQADWNKSWKGKHDLNVIAGWEIRNSISFSASDRKYGYDEEYYGVNPNIDYNSEYVLHNNSFVKQKIISNNSLGRKTDNFISAYFNGIYVFDKRYSASFSIRKDEANLFGVETNEKGTPLWSTGFKWDLAKEDFIKVEWIDRLSLRTTYGQNGNISRKVTAIPTINLSGSSYTTPLPSASLNGLPNKRLRWEKVNVLNVGLDLVFFQNRLTGSVEYFHKKSTDLIGESPLDPTLGRRLYYGNVASLLAKGMDLRITGIILNKGVKWNMTSIYGTSDPKITDYYMPAEQIGNTYMLRSGDVVNPVPGNPVFSMYGFKWAGLNGANGNPRGILDGAVSEDYANIYGKTMLSDLNYYGSIQPTRYGSLTNTFSFKDFDFSFTLSYKGGYSFRKAALSYTNLFSSWTGHGDYALRWQKEGDELNTDVPSLQYPINVNRDVFYQYTDVHILHGDHLRLENIRLNYALNDSKLSRLLSLKNTSFFFFMQTNKLLWSKNKKGIDPYFNNSPRNGTQWSFGLNTTF